MACFVHGRGRGHASRTVAIVRALRERGHRVDILAGGDALDLLGGDPSVIRVRSIPRGLGMVAAATERIRIDRAILRAFGSTLVISDGDMPALVVARRLGLPALAVGHEHVFLHSDAPDGVPLAMRAEQALNAWHAALLPDRAVAVHFLPVTLDSDRVRLARPALRAELDGPVRHDGPIVAYFRDRNGEQAIRALRAHGRRVLVFGHESAGDDLVYHRPFDPADFAHALRQAAAVVGSAGSNLLAEAIALGKPMLALHHIDEPEPRMNARLAHDARLAHAAAFGEEATAIPRFLDRVDRGDFRRFDLRNAWAPVDQVVCEEVEALASDRDDGTDD